jgi:lipoprotein-anchoring transpeptidase ErfK/SrfK
MTVPFRGAAGRRPLQFFAALVALIAAMMTVLVSTGPVRAATSVSVRIDLSAQRMQVSIGGRSAYNWAVSTARPGYRTPTGRFHPIRLERIWYSSIYDSAPMPYSIFFHGGYAIHGTYEIRNLGRAVSHGCVRLHPANAQTLFNLVRKYGAGNTLIMIVP